MKNRDIKKQKTDTAPESMADVFGAARPVNSDRLHLQPSLPPPEPAFTRADEKAVLAESMSGDYDYVEDTGDLVAYRSPSVSPKLFRKLRRGGLSVEDEIDLHGLTTGEALPALREFLEHARRRHLSCVRVVHGKGKGSGPRGPVLRGKVTRWLRRWSEVLAYCSARPADGGTGAVYVLLRRP